MSKEEQADYRKNKQNAEIIPLVFVSRDSQPTYESFRECYQRKLSKEDYFEGDKDLTDTFKAHAAGSSFINALEIKYGCASFCKTPLFYSTRGVQDGRPERECAAPMLAGLADNLQPIGTWSVVAGFIVFGTVLGSIPLCPGISKDEERKHLLSVEVAVR